MKILFAYIATFASFLSVDANIELGDCDRNGRVDFADIQPFIALLASGTYQEEADVNQDGSVNFLDIAPFIEVLSGGGSDPEIVPLFDETTILEPETTIDTPEALITTVGDRVRDRHAREGQFQAYDHYLPFYWEQRTVSIEIVDRVAKGGTGITINTQSLTPLGTRDFRAFFRGLNTSAEYHHNVGMEEVTPTQYTTTFSFNVKTGRPIQIGDRMEFEFSPFLANPTNGRTNYYGTAFLYVVGEGLKPWEGIGPILDSFALPEATLLGGKTTKHVQYSAEPDNLFKQLAGNTSPVSAQPFVVGRRLHHTDFGNGAHSEPQNPIFNQQIGKLGPKYIGRSCVECHVNNGRAFPPEIGNQMFQSVVRVGVDSSGTADPELGSVLQPRTTGGGAEGAATISSYSFTDGQFDDGQAYQLRKPEYSFTGVNPSNYSVRIATPLIGLGLIEAIEESTIIEMSDPNDQDGDGISGRLQTVTDPESGELRLGRFGYKAGQAKLAHQIAAALNTDIGVTTNIYPALDGETSSGAVELDDDELAQMTRYIGVLGVGAQRNYDDPAVVMGQQLFNSIGCAKCHTPTITTSPNHLWTELRSQTIHPYSDLLLHDLGPGLADNMGEGEASGAEWRTAPLWNIGRTADVGGEEAYLHDGRARSLEEAILWHGGEADSTTQSFKGLTASDRDALIEFLKSL